MDDTGTHINTHAYPYVSVRVDGPMGSKGRLTALVEFRDHSVSMYDNPNFAHLTEPEAQQLIDALRKVFPAIR